MPTFQQALPRPNPFKCSAQRHLWHHGLALAIYEKVGEITAGGKRTYHTDTAKMAQFFDANETFVRRTFAALNRAGWLVVVAHDNDTRKATRRTSAVKIRRWIQHSEWQQAHPGQCIAIDESLAPWSADTDPFCGQLWSAMDGKIRLYETMIKHARSCGRPDDEIVAAVHANWLAALEKKARKEYEGTGAKTVFFKTIDELKALAGKPGNG